MRYRFDDFQLDTEQFELKKSGELVHCEPQVLELLVFLIANRAQMVSKDELLNAVWAGKVVSDSALSSRIKMARQLLDDDGQKQRYIRTVHRKGFRFVADVVTDDGLPPATSTDQTDQRAVESPPTKKPIVAVLPFTNRSTVEGQDYFADGMTDDTIAQLSKHRWLDVVARNTSFGLKHSSMDIRQLGKELNVRYVVDGSVQRAQEQIRINVHLIDAGSGHHLWSERFDRTFSDIFALQDEITAKIVARIEPEIGFAERRRLVQSRPANLQTWDCFHLGIYHFYRFTGVDNEEAQRLLKRCQSLDPQFGEGFAWWAYAAVLGMVYWQTRPTQETLNEALIACDHALSLDDRNATFHALRARILLARQEYDAAIAGNEIAISLNPTFAAAYCGLGDSLAYEQRYDEALEYFTQAIALSPNDPQLWAFYTYGALALLFKGDFSEALNWTRKASNIPNYQYWTTAHQAIALHHLGATKDAQHATNKLMSQAPNFSLAFAKEKLFYLKEQSQIDFYLESLTELGIE